MCSICLELFREAVTIPCGHNFCQKCISNHWDKQEKEDPQGEERFTCPDCRKGFKTRLELKKNVSLCSVVELVKAGEVQASSTDVKAPADRGKCPRHGRPLELYCQEEKVCICCVCTVKECLDHHRVLFEEERKKKQVGPGSVSSGTCPTSVRPWRERRALIEGCCRGRGAGTAVPRAWAGTPGFSIRPRLAAWGLHCTCARSLVQKGQHPSPSTLKHLKTFHCFTTQRLSSSGCFWAVVTSVRLLLADLD